MNWRPWSGEAFEQAADEGKFVLLSVTASWCHWCHVMDRTTYADPEIQELIEKNAIPIRVDADRQPDIADRYNFGGFPSTAFLTSEGDIIDGTTYMPPEGFKKAMHALVAAVEETQTIPVSSAFQKRLKQFEQIPPAKRLDAELPTKFVQAIAPSFDHAQGGWGEQKFPMVDVVRICLKVNTDASKEMAQKTLAGMRKLHDDVEGGFFRYATKPDWSVPHYEKLLDENARLLELFAHKEDEEVTKKTTEYLLNTLKVNHAFGGSQDADEEYYAQDPRPKDKPAVDETIFTDRNSMVISAFLKLDNTRAHKAAQQTLQHILEKLTEENTVYHFLAEGPHRAGILADYVYLIQALLDMAEHAKNAEYLERADKLTQFVIQHFQQDKGGFSDRIVHEDDIGYLKYPLRNIVENAIMARNLHRLATRLAKEDYAHAAKKALLRFGNHVGSYGPSAATYALVVDELMNQ